MREIRQSGSEGGAVQSNALSLPLYKTPDAALGTGGMTKRERAPS
jgi:hypothetical protein